MGRGGERERDRDRQTEFNTWADSKDRETDGLAHKICTCIDKHGKIDRQIHRWEGGRPVLDG